MDKVYDLCFSFVLSLVLALCWGGFFYWFYPVLALPIGILLFCFCFLALMNACIDSDQEEEFPKHNRRFNDV